MLHELLLLASTTAAASAEEAEPSHLSFYVLGGGLALWAIVVAAFGMSRQQAFPASARGRNVVMLVTMLLVVGACGSAALTG